MAYYFGRPGRGNDLAVSLIAVLDVVTGIIVLLSRSFDFTSNYLVILMSFFYFCLGIWSIVKNVVRKNFFVWKEVVDIINAVCLLFIFYGSVYEIFYVLGIIIVLKGILGFFLMTTKA